MPSPRPASKPSSALRAGLAVAGAIGALCLFASTFATIIRIQVGTTSKVPDFDTHLSGGDRHGPALALLALFGLLMAVGTLRGARPAALALAAVGVAALVIVVITDLPDLNKVGFIGRLYENAVAGPRIGFYLESAGAVLMLLAGGLLLTLGAGELDERPRRRRERAAAAEPVGRDDTLEGGSAPSRD
jgi:hypothetical protein